MIKLTEAEPIHSVPPIIAAQNWAKALSYAVAQMWRRLFVLADATRTYSEVDKIDRHDVLDAMAVDLLINMYDSSDPIERKRELIKYALQYWATAGTVQATEEILNKTMGEGRVTEWYEYGGNPGCFKVLITNNEITLDEINRFLRVVENVKRLSAWLDAIVINLVNDPMTEYNGFVVHDLKKDETKQQRQPNMFVGFARHDYEKAIITQQR